MFASEDKLDDPIPLTLFCPRFKAMDPRFFPSGYQWQKAFTISLLKGE